VVPVDFRPDLFHAPQIMAGPYFAAIDAIGSPADSRAELEAQPDGVRQAADAVLLAAADVHFVVGGVGIPDASAPPVVLEHDGGTVAPSDPGCTLVTSDPDGSSFSMALPRGGLLITRMQGQLVRVGLRTLAEGWTAVADPAAALPAGPAVLLQVPTLAAPLDWQVQLSLVGGVEACALAAS
jgi:hypothetical protein